MGFADDPGLGEAGVLRLRQQRDRVARLREHRATIVAGSARRGRGSRRLELLRMAATPGGARLGSADRDRRAQGLAKTLGGSPQHEAHERER